MQVILYMLRLHFLVTVNSELIYCITNCLRSIYLHIYLPIYLSIYLFIHLSVYLWFCSPFVGPWPLFQILNPIHN
jgi:hypothetical protein